MDGGRTEDREGKGDSTSTGSAGVTVIPNVASVAEHTVLHRHNKGNVFTPLLGVLSREILLLGKRDVY